MRDARPSTATLPTWLDGAGLLTTEMRVLLHVIISGRTAMPIPEIAALCRMNAATCRRAVGSLSRLRLIRQTKRAGASTIIEATVPRNAPKKLKPTT